MTKFLKPGKHPYEYYDLANIAMRRALDDSGLDFKQNVEQVFCGYVYGDPCCGQKAVYTLGYTGVPVVNVNNNCSTGSTALYLANEAIRGGESECVMALGFEKMYSGSLRTFFPDRVSPLETFISVNHDIHGKVKAPMAPMMFGNAGREHMQKYGTKKEHFGKVAWKNHLHSVNNPYSQFRDKYTLDQIMAGKAIYEPLTKLQCCPTSDGAACAIICSEEFMLKHDLQDCAVEIKAIELMTDLPSTFNSKSSMNIVGSDMAT